MNGMAIKNQIIKILEEATGVKEINLEFPGDDRFGDFTTNVALILAKEQKKNPINLAEEIVEKINKDAGLSAVAQAKEEHGFINFWIKQEVLVENLEEVQKEKEKYGNSDTGKGKTVPSTGLSIVSMGVA